MKFPSFLRLFGERRKNSDRARRLRAGQQARQARLLLPRIDVLEDRTLLSVLPAPTILDRFRTGASNGIHDSSPVMAVNPLNPQKIVMVWVQNPVPGNQPFALSGIATSNGGQTWGSFGILGNFTDPLPNNVPYPQAVEPSVAFDRNNQFFVVWAQRRNDNAG